MENHVQDRTDRMGYSSAVNAANAIEISNHIVKRNLISTIAAGRGGGTRGASRRGRNLVPVYRRPSALAPEHSVPLLDAGNNFSEKQKSPLCGDFVSAIYYGTDFSECVPGRRGCAVHLYQETRAPG